MYVCLCKGLTESDVRGACHLAKKGPEVLTAALGLDDDDCCGRCTRNINDLVAIATGSMTCGLSS